MTRDEIIRMAKEAGQADGTTPLERSIVIYAAKSSLFLEKFAAIVAAAEREACAKWIESRKTGSLLDSVRDGEAAAIRARGEA